MHSGAGLHDRHSLAVLLDAVSERVSLLTPSECKGQKNARLQIVGQPGSQTDCTTSQSGGSNKTHGGQLRRLRAQKISPSGMAISCSAGDGRVLSWKLRMMASETTHM